MKRPYGEIIRQHQYAIINLLTWILLLGAGIKEGLSHLLLYFHPEIVGGQIGYKNGIKAQIKTPLTLTKWILSILQLEKDEMSPPIGWRMRKDDKLNSQEELDANPKAYGMGKLALDTTSTLTHSHCLSIEQQMLLTTLLNLIKAPIKV